MRDVFDVAVVFAALLLLFAGRAPPRAAVLLCAGCSGLRFALTG